jgi:hypothetical protein
VLLRMQRREQRARTSRRTRGSKCVAKILWVSANVLVGRESAKVLSKNGNKAQGGGGGCYEMVSNEENMDA